MNALRAVPSLLLTLGMLLSPRFAAAQTVAHAPLAPAAVVPVALPVTAAIGRMELSVPTGLQTLRLETPLALPSQPAPKTDAKAATLDPFSVGEVISQVEYTPEGLPMQQLAVPLSRQIEVRFVSGAYLSEVAALLERLGLSVVSKLNPERFIVAVAQDADARALADALEKEPLVLYATAKSFTLPIERQVSVTFKTVSVRSIPMGGGKVNVEQAVTDDEVAGILRSRGLRVLEVRADGYRVGAEGLDAEAAARELAADPLVLEAHPAKNQPSSDRWISVTFVRSYVVMTDGGWGIEVGMDEDTVADFLKKHGLQLVLIGGGRWNYLLAPSGDRPVDEVVAELAQNGLVAAAVRSEDPAPPAAASLKAPGASFDRPVLPAAKAVEELGARIAERLRAVSDASLRVPEAVLAPVLAVPGVVQVDAASRKTAVEWDDGVYHGRQNVVYVYFSDQSSRDKARNAGLIPSSIAGRPVVARPLSKPALAALARRPWLKQVGIEAVPSRKGTGSGEGFLRSIAERIRRVLDATVKGTLGRLIDGQRRGVSAAVEPDARSAAKMDPDLQARLATLSAKQAVSVILTLAEPAGKSAQVVRKRLRAMGVAFSELEGLGMIVAPLTRAQAEALAATAQVAGLSLDGEVSAL
ncbi:MAG: hypothetical protein WC969_00520 [Elusimicrobiota bacterium]|jgi:hypothetical protein